MASQRFVAAMLSFGLPFPSTTFPFVVVGTVLFGNVFVYGGHGDEHGDEHGYVPSYVSSSYGCNKGEWSTWTQCTHQCGENGTQYRERHNSHHCAHTLESVYRQCNRRCYNGGELDNTYTGSCDCPEHFDGTCCETYDDSVSITPFNCYTCDEAYSKTSDCVDKPTSLPTESCSTVCFVELTLLDGSTDEVSHIKRGCRSASEVAADPCQPQACPDPRYHPHHSVPDNGTCALCCIDDLCNDGLPASSAAEVTYNIISAGLMLAMALLLN